jgi:hypothetical protein
VLEEDEAVDQDRETDIGKPKFTFTECIIALIISITLVTLLAVFLVEKVEHVVKSGVPDQFLGLILLPLVEKAAEHLTAIDEAWDGSMVSADRHLRRFDHILTEFTESSPLSLPCTINSDCPSARSNGGNRRVANS